MKDQKKDRHPMSNTSNTSKNLGVKRTMYAARDTISAKHRAYRKGNKALATGNLDLAEALVQQAVSHGEAPAAWIQRLGFIQERAGKFETALRTYNRAIALDGSHSEWYYRAGVCAKALGNSGLATEMFESAVNMGDHHDRAAKALSASIPANTPGWRRLELLESALRISDDTGILKSAATLSFNMKQYENTIQYVDRLDELGSVSESERILQAISFIEKDAAESAFRILKKLTTDSKNSKARKIGAGYYLSARHDWRNAKIIHEMEWLESGESNYEAAFGVAYSLDRQYQWEQALQWYERAIEHPQGDRAYWAYKYAHCLERSGNYSQAAGWYSRGLDLGGMAQADWFYRLGYCEYKLERFDEAYQALAHYIALSTGHKNINLESQGSPEVPKTDGEGSYKQELEKRSRNVRNSLLGNAAGIELAGTRALAKARMLRSVGHLSGACKAYQLYIKHVSEPEKSIVFEAASCFYDDGRTAEACVVLLDAREFFRPDGIDQKKFLKSGYERRRARYAEYTQRFPVDAEVVLFESYWGTKIADNPLAIYKAMRLDSRFSNHIFYWTVSADTPIPKHIKDDDRTFLVKYGSRKYDRLLASAGTLVNNTSFVQYFSRREGQRYLNTWHGTPIKTLGKKIGTGVLEHANVTRNFLNATDLIMPNEYTARRIVEDYELAGISTANIDVVGSPRLDALVSGDALTKSEVRNKLGLDSIDSDARVVLYAPTWRGSADERGMDISIALEALTELASLENTKVLFRAHHLAETALEGVQLDATVVPPEIETYDLLQVVDVLVSDYSSLLIDFLVTRKPVVCYAPDLDVYRDERGMYFELEELTQNIAVTGVELRNIMSGGGPAVGDTETRARERFSSLEDGGASSRTLDRLANGWEPSRMDSGRTTLVVFESMIPNGIRSSFFNLTRLIDTDRYDIKVCLDVRSVVNDPRRQQGLEELGSDIGVIGRNGEMAMTLEERYALAEFSKRFGETSPKLEELVNSAYRREFARIFGHPENVVFLDFEGYSRFWNALLSRGVPDPCQSGVILHNQMDQERDRRFPHMAEIIRNYGLYDSVASVSRAISRGNVEAANELGVHLRRPPMVVHNSIDSDNIRTLADQDASLWSQHEEASPRLVSVGRLSPEKNQGLLIEMMPYLLESYPNAELIVIGDGPSGPTLRARVRHLGLTKSVHFVGFNSNPMPTVKDSDLFVLSSVHEGQPMVIFEAMALGIPVLTTPVPGCVEACESGDGHVVDLDPELMANEAMRLFERESIGEVFDPIGYNALALQEFDAFIANASSMTVADGGRRGKS